MSFNGLVIKNPFRNKTITLLAIIGTAIGIITIVALGVITDGLKSSSEETPEDRTYRESSSAIDLDFKIGIN